MRCVNWAAKWSALPVGAPDKVIICLDQDDDNDDVSPEAPQNPEVIEIDKSSQQRRRSIMRCPVRGCDASVPSVRKLVSHALISHVKAKITEDFRDLGWASQTSRRCHLFKLFGLPNVPRQLSLSFKGNPGNKDTQITLEVACDVRLTVDPKIGAALVFFCALQNDNRSILDFISERGTVHDYFAYFAFTAVELNTVSIRRLARLLALLRDSAFRDTDGMGNVSWSHLVSYLDRPETSGSIERIVKHLQPIQLAVMARPPTISTVRSSLIALQKFIITAARAKLVH